MNADYTFNWEKFIRKSEFWARDVIWMTLAFNLPSNVVSTLSTHGITLDVFWVNLLADVTAAGFKLIRPFRQDAFTSKRGVYGTETYKTARGWFEDWTTERSLNIEFTMGWRTHLVHRYTIDPTGIYRQTYNNPLREDLDFHTWCKLVAQELE